MTYKIGWFSTGRDKAARDLLKIVYENIKKGKIRNSQISFVFSNRIRGENIESDRFFDLVENLGIELIYLSSRKFKPAIKREDPERWRQLYDEEIIERIDPFRVDLIPLAGYMLILGRKICRRYSIINLHPALPDGPKGTWQEVIWQLIKKEANKTGVMMHIVTPDLDAGPPLTYCTFPIKGGKFDPLWEAMRKKLKKKTLEEIKTEEGEEEPLFKEIRKEGVKRELPLIVHTLNLLSEGKIKIRNGKPISN
jgi:phosphoribosylglycinamide formyltransferase-1